MPACSRTVLYSSDSVELEGELTGIPDPFEVRPFALDVAE